VKPLIAWLSALDNEYRNHSADCIWTQHINQHGKPGISRSLKNQDPAKAPWYCSHLRTFRKHLIWGANRELFKDEKGHWWRRAYDQVLYRPIVKVAKRRHFFDRVCMVYNEPEKPDMHDEQLATAAKVQKLLIEDFSYGPHSVIFFINGASDKNFSQVEKRRPLGVLSMTARLRARGHRVKLVDRFLHLNTWVCARELREFDTVGVYVSTPNFPDAREILRKLQRHRRGKYFMAGGPHAVLHPESLIQWVDCVCTGEADFDIARLVERRIPGIVNPGRVQDLDTVPFPDFALTREQKMSYCDKWPFDSTRPVFALNSSRSCPNECSFCDVRDIWGRKWVAQSPERMVEDVRHLVSAFGAKGIYFREDNFACSERRVLEFCRLLRNEKIAVKWACEIRADQARKKHLVDEMAQAGCRGFYIGGESGSDRMLEIYNKGITRKDVIAACHNAHVHGVAVALSTIFDHPEETKKDRALTASMVAEACPAIHWECKFRAKGEK